MSISYWLDQNVSESPSTKTYDFIIAGGGIAGLSTAYWLLKKDPSLKIAILEKNRVGFGASGRNAGFVTCGSTEHFMKLMEQFGLEMAVETWKFSEENRRLLIEHIIQDQASTVEFRNTGSCTVAPNEERWAKYKQISKMMQSSGINVHEVDTHTMENDYGIKGFVGGIQYTGDGYVHPIKLLALLRSKLTVDIFEGAEVFSIAEKNGNQYIRTDKGLFKSAKVVLALNAYLPLVMKNFEKLVTPGRGQVLLTEPLPHFVKGPCYFTKHLCYFRQLPSGHLLVGGFRNLATDIENTYVDETTPLIQNALHDFIKDHFKYGQQAKVAYQWSGIMGFTPDGQMLLGTLPDNSNVHIMAGCSGHGMGLSFNAARTLVDGIFGNTIPSRLNLNRFLKN